MKSPDKNVEAVRESLLTRSQVGLKNMASQTERDDLILIDWLRHLQLELMDATIYIEAAINNIKEKNDNEHSESSTSPI